jgi:hypothetical protein
LAKFPCWMTPTLPEASMSKRLLSIFLLVSLALNAGIVGGLVVMGLFRKQHDLHHYQNFRNDPGVVRKPVSTRGTSRTKTPKPCAIRSEFPKGN